MDKQNLVNFLDMSCVVEGHEGNKLVALCIDKSCSLLNKFVCLDCIFNLHEQHKMAKLKLIQEKINYQLEHDSSSKDEEIILSRLRETEDKIKMEVEKIKTNILEIFNNKMNNFLTEINDKILEHKSTKTESFDLNILSRKEIKHFTKEELDNLTNYLNLNFVINQNLNESIVVGGANTSMMSDKKKSPVKDLENFDENFKKYILEVNKVVCEFLSAKFLQTSTQILFCDNSYFEWSEKTFGNYGFLYNLSNNKTTATKIGSDGTITICRSKEKLNMNENYFIEFLIECKKYGDIEVGIGKDSVGPTCWLRSVGAYGITNVGIYENGKTTKKDIRLEDGDIIAFEVYLKTPPNSLVGRNLKMFKNGKLVNEVKIEIDEIYPMLSIRKCGNSITVRDFKTLN